MEYFIQRKTIGLKFVFSVHFSVHFKKELCYICDKNMEMFVAHIII